MKPNIWPAFCFALGLAVLFLFGILVPSW